MVGGAGATPATPHLPSHASLSAPSLPRRIACASFVIMIFGVLLLLWLVYGCYVFSAPIDVFHNGTKIAPNRWNEKLFASPDCFALHQEGFWLVRPATRPPHATHTPHTRAHAPAPASCVRHCRCHRPYARPLCAEALLPARYHPGPCACPGRRCGAARTPQ